jgi:hypothetical protein
MILLAILIGFDTWCGATIDSRTSEESDEVTTDLGLVGLRGRVAAPALGVPEHRAVEGEAVNVHLVGSRRGGGGRGAVAEVLREPVGDPGGTAHGAPHDDLPLVARHRRHRPRTECAEKNPKKT